MQSECPWGSRHLTRKPDFSQTCSFNRMIKFIIGHDLNPNNLHISGHFFFVELQKNPLSRFGEKAFTSWHTDILAVVTCKNAMNSYMFPSSKRNNDLASGIGSGISFRRLISDKRNGLIFPSRPNKKRIFIR